jgi:sulfur-oxidizing protein SoxY
MYNTGLSVSRRGFVTQTAAGLIGLHLLPRKAIAQGQDRQHQPLIEVPLLSEDGTAVPIKVSVDHPMEPDHFIRSLEVMLDNDPVPSKGTFFFSPANGKAWMAYQMRSGVGGVLKVIGECSRHGRFIGSAELRVVGGGCTIAPEKIEKERLGHPMIRLPATLRSGDIVEVRAKIDHHSSTGLIEKGGKFIRERPEFYVRTMAVYLGPQKVSEFSMTSAVSANPLIRFPLKITGPGVLRIVFQNSEGQQWEALHQIQPTS